MLKIILMFLQNIYLYHPNMGVMEVYKYFIKDKNEDEPKDLTRKFYKGLRGIRKDIVDYDSKDYYSKQGHNNMAKLLVKYPNETENTIKYIKRQMRENLYLRYVSRYGFE